MAGPRGSALYPRVLTFLRENRKAAWCDLAVFCSFGRRNREYLLFRHPQRYQL